MSQEDLDTLKKDTINGLARNTSFINKLVTHETLIESLKAELAKHKELTENLEKQRLSNLIIPILFGILSLVSSSILIKKAYSLIDVTTDTTLFWSGMAILFCLSLGSLLFLSYVIKPDSLKKK